MPELRSRATLRGKRQVRVRSGSFHALGVFGYLAILVIPAVLVFALASAEPTQAQGQATPTGQAMEMSHKPCDQAALAFSSIQTPVPATAAPTSAAPAATPAASPQPTPTLRPAPKTDRVGPLENYPANWNLMYVHDRGINAQVRVICGNDVAASAKPGEPFPYGSVIVMETWRAKAGSTPGTLALDENGHLIRENLVSLHVMRKEQGFGADYKEFQSGEWEYMGYTPNLTVLNPPETTGFCAACHSAALDEKTDWTFRAAAQGFDHSKTFSQILPAAQQAVQMVVVAEVAYGPNNVKVKPGTTVIFNNLDVVNHTVTARDGSFDSGIKAPNSTFSMIFDKPGTYQYFCSLHPAQMSGTITVAE